MYCRVHFKLSHVPPSAEGELVKGFANASDNIYFQLYHLKLNCDQALVRRLAVSVLGDGVKTAAI